MLEAMMQRASQEQARLKGDSAGVGSGTAVSVVSVVLFMLEVALG